MTIRLVVFMLCLFLSGHVYSGFLTNQYDEGTVFESQDFQESDFQDQPFQETSRKTIYRKKISENDINPSTYDYNLPARITTTEKTILVDPNVHAWGAYAANGKLIRAGLATAGAEWCDDIGRACKTKAGVFRIYSLGDGDCTSSKYPISQGGGAPMPYCMYFNGAEGLHGSNQVVEDNISHGCVRLRVSDAKWLRYHFATQGTKVIIKHY